MVCPCCANGCDACPSICAFDFEISIDDAVGSHSYTLSHSDCADPCTDSVYDQATIGNDYLTIAANYLPIGAGVTGYGRVDETDSSGGVGYTRGVSITGTIECDPATKKWVGTFSLDVSDFESTDPFYSGIGFQKEKTLVIQYSATAELGCADATSSVTAVADGSGVTIAGTSYSWTVNSYAETCKELDGSQQYQPCVDYLAPAIPEVTFTLSKRAGC